MKLRSSIIGLWAAAILLSAVANIGAQIKKPVKKTPPVKLKIGENTISIPEVMDFAFVVEIDKNAKVAVSVQKTENGRFLADSASKNNLTDFFTALSKSSFDPVIVVKADESLEFGQLVGIIRSLRVSPKQKIKLQISENYYVGIPAHYEESDVILKPNPNYLLAVLQEDSKILLNRDEYGDLRNLAPLQEILRRVFKDREDRGVLREGTNEVETTVSVGAAPTVKFRDVIKLIRAVAEAGASPVGLEMGDSVINKIEM